MVDLIVFVVLLIFSFFVCLKQNFEVVQQFDFLSFKHKNLLKLNFFCVVSDPTRQFLFKKDELESILLKFDYVLVFPRDCEMGTRPGSNGKFESVWTICSKNLNNLKVVQLKSFSWRE